MIHFLFYVRKIAYIVRKVDHVRRISDYARNNQSPLCVDSELLTIFEKHIFLAQNKGYHHEISYTR